MALLRSSQKLNQLLIRSTNFPNQSQPPLSFLLRHSPRHFCTQNEQPPQQQLQQQQQPQQYDMFLRPSQGVVYGKLWGINENTLKTDIINLLEGCRLTVDDIKVDYDRMFYPMAMLVQFHSSSDFQAAIRVNNRKGRLYKLEKADRQQWDLVMPHNGRYVLLQGIPRNAVFDDVERVLSGCNFDSSSFELFTRGPEPIRMAKVRFPSPTEAMNAVIQKNGTFCLNNRIHTRLLQ